MGAGGGASADEQPPPGRNYCWAPARCISERRRDSHSRRHAVRTDKTSGTRGMVVSVVPNRARIAVQRAQRRPPASRATRRDTAVCWRKGTLRGPPPFRAVLPPVGGWGGGGPP